ncbi:heme-binding protein [Leeia sp. TBRC 13508]|uniref:Heme-binding protein n=1 Tax=Leeia speluncae TaxID=2884804 RepID=A0ABS8D9J9_9NEIS|nr:heme-binding protein [Leeia speluncae]MCB6184889.1 heme-binding protein [Leeia speluncae]
MNQYLFPVSYSIEQLSLGAAQAIAAVALDTALQNGWRISVAVVDASGQLIAFAKQDGAIGITPDVAIGKAKTAALLKSPSKHFEDFINQGQPSFLSTPGVTALEGGVPIEWNDQIIGAVGVSGAHGVNDSTVATIAANSIYQLNQREME